MRRTNYSIKRGERKSFYCSYEFYQEMKRATKGCYSISTLVRLAVKEKIERDFNRKIDMTL